MSVMTHVNALNAGQSSQGTSEPITPVCGATCDIVIGNITSFINVVNFDTDD